MSGYLTRAELAAMARARIARRVARHPHRDYSKRDIAPLPMSTKFWRDVEMMHLRCRNIMERRTAFQRDNRG